MNIVIIKYNVGNVRSVDFALRRLGVEPVITDDFELIRKADKVIFPGVGEASGTMHYLRSKGLDEVIKNLTQPVLGICLGMQLLCRHSDEGNVAGLGVFDIDVNRFDPKLQIKIPHMGWNTVNVAKSNVFSELENRHLYFVHSYFIPQNEHTILTVQYGTIFSAAIQYKNFYGVQFHPEKSGDVGAQLLQNFLTL